MVVGMPQDTSDVCSEPWLWLENLNISSRGTLSAHGAVILTASDISSLLCVVPYGMMNKVSHQGLLEILVSVASSGPPLHLMVVSQLKTFSTK